jgi:DNA-binding CsgD family transcriptional regulator
VFRKDNSDGGLSANLRRAAEVSAAGVVLLDTLSRFYDGEIESGLFSLRQLRQSNSLSELIRVLCPDLSGRNDGAALRIRRLISAGCDDLSQADLPRSIKSNPSQADDDPGSFHGAEGGALTARQRIALQLVRDGCSNREMARVMAISENTVKWHLKETFRRLGVINRCAALKVAESRGLI